MKSLSTPPRRETVKWWRLNEIFWRSESYEDTLGPRLECSLSEGRGEVKSSIEKILNELRNLFRFLNSQRNSALHCRERNFCVDICFYTCRCYLSRVPKVKSSSSSHPLNPRSFMTLSSESLKLRWSSFLSSSSASGPNSSHKREPIPLCQLDTNDAFSSLLALCPISRFLVFICLHLVTFDLTPRTLMDPWLKTLTSSLMKAESHLHSNRSIKKHDPIKSSRFSSQTS